MLAVGPREARVEEGKGQREENSLEERAGASVSGDLTLRPCMAVSGLARQLTATAFQVVGGSSSAVYSTSIAISNTSYLYHFHVRRYRVTTNPLYNSTIPEYISRDIAFRRNTRITALG